MLRFGMSRWKVSAVSGAIVAAMAGAALPAAAVPTAAVPTAAVQPAERKPPVPARYADQRLDWGRCDPGSALECAAMTVPRDWHHPGTGADLTVEVSRHRADDPARRRGVLMMAAGGPGASGLGRPASFAEDMPAVAAVYDIVSFDQRGLGRSTPVRCQTEEEFQSFFAGDFRDRSPAAIGQVLARSRQLADSCLRRSGDLLHYITTDQTVRDMDLYRSLLGVEQISYYGPSYATTIGAYYATEFPRRVERVVLDSNIAFNGTGEAAMSGQPMSFQRRFEQDFLPWLATYDSVYHYGATAAEVKAHWEARRSALHDHPLTVGSLVLGPNQLDNGTIQALYNAAGGFPALATALTALDHWDSATPAERKLVAKLFGSYLSAGFLAEFFSVTCNDTPWSRDIGDWVRRSGKDAAAYPLAGARELAFAATCAAWPASPAPRVKVTGAGLPTVLMLNSVHDPATYYEGALAAHRALRGSRLVTVTGGGDHGQYRNKNACVDGIVNTYLLTGAAPAHDTNCAADPLPVPARSQVPVPNLS
ncbi:alpha/beta hydrolase [Streptomyces sp. H10-C2]|uniref:alpha/beta hydrolase n=1 Tax=unclassified Streptomyces TaxID=2593676 RepID=UPI0024B8F3C3|nr:MULTISPECIES: alpha/beta hydrolase [unclassified Streptomyces]MDJ0346225.1 alpha/beta hydrolase [Streptomyces sp. PH10-H1]MDJ0371739.1 alpha/beta hydrolase [Streptomyces sp. H10-C2]